MINKYISSVENQHFKTFLLVQALGAQKGQIGESFGVVLIFGAFMFFGSLNTNLKFANKIYPGKLVFSISSVENQHFKTFLLVQALGPQKGQIGESFGVVLIFGAFMFFGSLNTNLKFANKIYPGKLVFWQKTGFSLFFPNNSKIIRFM